MKKKLLTKAIVNELSGSSAFFHKPAKQTKDAQFSKMPKQQSVGQESLVLSPTQTQPHLMEKEQHKKTTNSNYSRDESQIDSKHDSQHASYHASTIEHIRKIVKDGGREVSYIRLSGEEKQQTRDLVYTYNRQGIKTTENEIVRIALNFILEDYQESGKESVLERVIEALNA